MNDSSELAGAISRELGSAVSSADLVDALNTSLLATGNDVDHAVVLVEEGADLVKLCLSSDPRFPPGTALELEPGPWSNALRDGAPWYADAENGTMGTALGSIPVGTVLPLRSRDDHYGALVLPSTVSEEQRDAAELVAQYLGPALVQVQLYEELSRRYREEHAKLGVVSQIGEAISGLDLETLLAKLMELAVTSVSAEVGSIVLRDESGTPRVESEWGLSEAVLEGLRVPDGTPLVEAVIGAKQALIATDVSAGDVVVAEGLGEACGSLVGIPLATADRVLGGLFVAKSDPGGLASADLELLKLAGGLSSKAIENAILHKSEIEKETLRAQLRLAGDIQRALLPAELPTVAGLECAAQVWPCDESGGDYYDFFPFADGKVGFCVGDATGHGIGAALIVTNARAMLRARIDGTDSTVDLAELFGGISGLLEDDMADGKFITMFFGIYDPVTRGIRYVSAGHDCPIVYRSAEDRFDLIEATGAPLGIIPGLVFETADIPPLAPGDVLLAKSDGVTEASRDCGEQYGDDRLFDLIRRERATPAAALVQAVKDDVRAFRGDDHQADDITLVCLRAS